MKRNKGLRRVLVAIAAVLATVVLPVEPAGAAIGTGSSMTVPSGVAVGDQNLAGSITAINTNSAPQNTQANTLTTVAVALSCGAVSTAANLCPIPDPGVFQISPAAAGAAGTACAGVNFTASAPNPSGIVTFTPVSTVTLAPPGGAPGSDRCTVNFTFSGLKQPTIDTNAAVGIQTVANALVSTTALGVTVSSRPTTQITVARATATIVTLASPTTLFEGATFMDTATLTGVAGIATPTGTVTFTVFGPNNPTCTGAPFATSTVPVAGNTAVSAPVQATQPGVYRFTATYNGDVNYNAATSPCNAANEAVTVRPRRAVADFDGDDKTDLSVFRPASATWFINRSAGGQTIGAYGANGDVPVPGNYDDDALTDLAVFRPTTGTWFVHRSSGGDTIGNYGAAGDIPVPGDYDGDTLTDLAVFRPASATWFIRKSTGGEIIGNYGANGDVPVSGDYDGDGKTDLAVFRPASATWFVHNTTGGDTVGNYGIGGDVPVPGDYDGDGRTDLAVFRPGSATWFVHQSTGGDVVGAYGIGGDMPVPGDYDGDRKTDLAVFRPGSATWFVHRSTGGDTIGSYGIAGDIPLPLPAAIRLRFF